MTRWFNNGKEPPQVALEKIVSFFHKLDRPVYLGFIATEIKYSLEQTRAMLDVLHDAGAVRPLSVEEKRAHGLDERDDIWTLVEEAHPGKANW